MSCNLTSGRTELSCFDNIGGVKRVYLMPFVSYNISQIVGTRGVEVTSFPYTTIYAYETTNANFNEQINNDENGVSYSQSLTFTLLKQDLATTKELNNATKIDLRYIVEFNDGKYRFGGLWKGATISSIDLQSGGSKADGNLYNLTINSEEEYSAAYLDDLTDFEEYNTLLLQDGFSLLLEDGFKIILE